MGQARNTIRVQTQVLTQYDWITASQDIKPTFGVVIVEMMPKPNNYSNLLLPEECDVRDDIGMVIAAHPSTNCIPGTYVAVNHEAGKHIDNFRCGRYVAQNQVRIFGRQTKFLTKREPRRDIWQRQVLGLLNKQILGDINVNVRKINYLSNNAHVHIDHRTSIDTYESYVRLLPSPSSYTLKVSDPYGTFENELTIEGGKAYRLVVRNVSGELVGGGRTGGVLDVRAEVLGDHTMEEAFATDREIPIIPRNTKVLVELDDLHDKSAHGIYVTAGYAHRDSKGTVIRVGPFCQDVKPGDRVLIQNTAIDFGNQIAMDGINNKALKMIDEEGILSILPGEMREESEERELVCQ